MKLKTKDIFKIARFVSKIDIRKELQQAVNGNPEEVGNDILWAILEKCSKEEVEKEFYSLASYFFEMPENEIEEMDPIELIGKIKEVADFESWKSFFTAAVS